MKECRLWQKKKNLTILQMDGTTALKGMEDLSSFRNVSLTAQEHCTLVNKVVYHAGIH